MPPRRFVTDSLAFILLIGFVTAVQAMSTTLTLPALPAIAREFGVAPDIAQFTLSGFLIGVASGQILSGALSDRFGRRPVLLTGLVLSVATGVGCTFASSMGLLIAMRVLQGFGCAAGMILGRAIVRDAFARDKALKAMSGIALTVSIVPMLGPPIAGMLLELMSWRAVFALLTLITTVITVLVYVKVPETLKQPDTRATDPRRILLNCTETLRNPASIGFSLMASLIYGGVFSYLAVIPFVARDSFGLSGAVAGWLIGAGSLAIWFGATLNNRLTGRWPVRRLLDLSSTLAIAGALATLAATLFVAWGPQGGTATLALIVIPAMVFSFTFGITQPTAIVMALQPLPHIAGTASALGASFQTLSGALFSSIAAALYTGTPVSMGVCMAIAGALSFSIYRSVARHYSPAHVGGK
ncbi:MAG: multidrug effflux MFS transporter [Betaproteobacteria bacterium]|nr:multidrug effflux MFS transporter [Betaproteobacteria bacterium]